MEIKKKIEIDLIKDGNILKWRVNFVNDDLIFGWLKPV